MSGDTYPPEGCIILTEFLNITEPDQYSKAYIESFCESFAKKTKDNNKNAYVGGVIGYNEIEMEPFTDNLFTDIIDIYSSQAQGYEKGGADFLYLKDIKSLGHLRGALLGAKSCKLPVVASVYIDDDGELCNGTSLLSSLLISQSLGAKVFLINGKDKDVVLKEFAEILPFSNIPVVANATLWNDDTILENEMTVKEVIKKSIEQNTYMCWKQVGNFVKICCSNKKIHQKDISSNYEIALSSAREPFLLNDMYEVSTPYSSEKFFPDDFLEIEDLDFDVIQIHLTTKQYAYHIAINAYMLEKPICFLCDDEEILKTALLYYKGIPLVNGDCEILEDRLSEICEEYGAVLTMENTD